MNDSGSSNRKLFTYARYHPDSSGVITQSGPSLVSFRPNTHLERRDFTIVELPCSTEAACDSPPPNIMLRMASDRPRALLSDRRCSADIYPHQLYHHVINTTLVTIVVGKLSDYYPWMGRGEPTPGGGESPSYGDNGIKRRWEAMAILRTTGIHK